MAMWKAEKKVAQMDLLMVATTEILQVALTGRSLVASMAYH